MGLGVVTIGAAPAILAACGGEEEAAPPPPAEPAEPPAEPAPAEPPAEPAPPAEPPPATAPPASGPLDYLSREGYDVPVESMVLDSQTNAEAAIYLVAGVTVEAALPLLDEATASLYDYSDVDSFFAKAPLYNNPPLESDEYVTIGQWQERWQELKASA